MSWHRLFATATLAGLLAMPCQAGEVGDYLTREGNLKESVTVKTGRIEFLAPSGADWTIAPSGEWTEKFADVSGKLSAKEVAALAQHFATQDFNSLPKTQGYDPVGPDGVRRAGYDYVVIAFGKKEAAFYIKIGASRADYVPKPEDPKAMAYSRFIALELILTNMLQTSELKQEPAK